MSKERKPWKIAVNDVNYGIRGHKLYAVLSYIKAEGPVTYTEINRFAYNYTRRGKKNKFYTGLKFDKVRDRGYIGANFYGYGVNAGFIGRCVDKVRDVNNKVWYELNEEGKLKLRTLRDKFGGRLF